MYLENDKIAVKNKEYLEIMLFMAIRNNVVIPGCFNLIKDESKINEITYRTMMIYLENREPSFDIDLCKKAYQEGRKQYLDSYSKKRSLDEQCSFNWKNV